MARANLLMAFAFVLSLTMALVSGFLLWRGDVGDAVTLSLPSSCEVTVLVERPAAARTLARSIAAHVGLPTPLTPWAAALERWDRTLAGLDDDAPAGACRRDGAWLWSVGLDSRRADAAEALTAAAAAAWPAAFGQGSWVQGQSVGAFVDHTLRPSVGHVRAAALAGPERMQLLLDGRGADAALAKLVAALPTASLHSDTATRAVFERVGGGALRLVLAQGPARAASSPLDVLPPLASFVRSHATFAGIAVRDDLGDGRTHLHVHIGADQAGVGELKRLLDPGPPLAVSAAVTGGAAGGVVRMQPQAWLPALPQLRALPWVHAAVGALEARGLDFAREVVPALQGTVVFRVGRPGAAEPAAFLALRLRDGAAPPWLARLAAPVPARSQRLGAVMFDAQWLVLVPGDVDAARVALAWLQARPGAAADASTDRLRILDDSQGAYVDVALGGWGPLEFELLWLDTGLVGHLALRP